MKIRIAKSEMFILHEDFENRFALLRHQVVCDPSTDVDIVLVLFNAAGGVSDLAGALYHNIKKDLVLPHLFIRFQDCFSENSLRIRGAINSDCTDEELEQALQETAALAKK